MSNDKKVRKSPFANPPADRVRRSFKRRPEASAKVEASNSAVRSIEKNPSGTVLSKYIAHAGVCSRRKVEQLVAQGLITINNVVVTQIACRVQSGDVVKVCGNIVEPVENMVYILLNKPNNCITTTSDDIGRRTVMDLLGDVPERVYPVGRLDRKTTGLLLFTNDGELAERLSHPRYEVHKMYHVVLHKPVYEDDIAKLRSGVYLPDGMVSVDDIMYVPGMHKKEVLVVVHSGKYRVVRRMFEALNYDVVKLDRVEFAGLTKKGLTVGQWRHLSKEEVRRLKEPKKFDE